MLNFKDWQKVAEDKHTTTMRHGSGHTMTLINKQMPSIQREQLKRLKLAGGTPDGTVSDTDDDSSDDSSSAAPAPATNITINAAQPQGQQAPPAAPQTSSVAAQYAQQPVVAQSPTVPQTAPSNLNPDGTMNPSAVAQNSQAGAGLQRDVDIAKGKAMADVQHGYTQGLAETAQRDQDVYNNYAVKPVQDFKNYITQNPIDTKHWAESQSSAQKVTTALGLLMGGFKQGFSGGSNPAYDWVNSQIDRDLKSQQQNVENQKTVLGAYQHLYGQGNASNALAKASLRDIYDSKAKEVATQLNTPQAWANYQQFAADQAIKKSKDLQDAAVSLRSLPGFRGTGSGGAGVGGSSPGTTSSTTGTQNGGASGSWGEGTAEASQPEAGIPSKILAPNAQGVLNSLRYAPKARDEINQIKEQYTQAQQAEKALAAIDDKFPKLRSEATYSGNIASHVNPNALAATFGTAGALIGGGGLGALSAGTAAIPGAIEGAGLGAAAGKGLDSALRTGLGVAGGQQQVQYDADRATVAKVIAAALKGTNINSEQIQDIVDSNTPSVWDSQATYQKKLNNIKEFIHQNTPTSLLEDWGLAKPRK